MENPKTLKQPLINDEDKTTFFESKIPIPAKSSAEKKRRMSFDLGDDEVDSSIYNLPNIDEVNSKVMCKLLTVSVVCIIFMIVEVVGGYIANSLAIMTDAAHLLADCTGFFISIFSLWLAKKPSSHVMSFGYHRAEVIGALASVILIWILTGFLVYEAIERITTMAFEMKGWFMLGTAIFGLFCNLTMGKILHSHGGHGHDHGHDHGGHSHGGHSHGGHSHGGHSHGGHDHKKKAKNVKPTAEMIKEHPESFDKERIELSGDMKKHHHDHPEGEKHDHDHDHEEHGHDHHDEHDHDHDHKEHDHAHKDHKHEHKKDHDHPHKEHDHEHGDHDHHDHDDHEIDLENPANKKKKNRKPQTLSTMEERDNVNLRAAMIHVLGDTIQSVGVVIAAIIVVCEPTWKIVDPICTLVFAVIVLFTTVGVSRDCILVLMEATPAGIDVAEFNKELEEVVGVQEVHDLHIWSLAPGKPALSAHLFSTDVEKSMRLATVVCRKYGIFHSTIQVEDWHKRYEPGFIKCDHNIHN